MKTAKKLLKFNFDERLFSATFDNLLLPSTLREIKNAQTKIKEIELKFSPFKIKVPPDVGKIFRLFMEDAKKGYQFVENDFNNNTSYVRKLAWSLSYQENGKSIIQSEYYLQALKIIDDNFKISMLLPLFDALMKNWISADTKPLKRLISEKLQNINSKKQNFKAIKSKAVYYLPSNGIIALCEEIIKDDEQLDKLLDFLEIPQSMVRYEYFGEAAETYTKLITRNPDFIDKIDEILSFLKKHHSKDTHKKCIEKIVLKLNETDATESIRMKILNFCFQYIGDPSSDHKWSPWVNSNKNDRQNLEDARKVLNNWLAKKFIYLFFDKLSMDSDRRIFWNRYINYVTNFKIYMDSAAVESFKRNNQEIEPAILKHKLGILDYGGGTSSFVLAIKNYYFVEFSQTGGACYIYKSENENKPNLNWGSVSLSQLKNSNNRQMAVSLKAGYYHHREEGRVFHQRNWQPKFKFWMEEHLGIRV